MLLAWLTLRRVDMQWRDWWRHYLISGLLTTGMPSLLFSYAARYLPASYSAIINASTPLFGTLFAAIWLSDAITPRKLLGIVLGICGVAIVSQHDSSIAVSSHFYLAIGACIGAAICYGLASIYIKKYMANAQPISIACGSHLLAGIFFLPLTLFNLPTWESLQIFGIATLALNALGLSLLCSALAYILFYQLAQQVGPTKTLSVTLLVPLFSMLWGALFLHEIITLTMLAGCALVLFSTYLVIYKNDKK
ncbi:MAG: EamA family transporter [Ottowia sp.]|nr:EamA family transporter [Ottowia sp.]